MPSCSVAGSIQCYLPYNDTAAANTRYSNRGQPRHTRFTADGESPTNRLNGRWTGVTILINAPLT